MRRAAWALVAVAMGIVACSGGAGEVTAPSLDPVAATQVTTSTSAAASTTVVETTTVATTTGDTAVPVLTGPVFSDELGVKVATAPGVNTPGDTRQLLPEGLYVHIAWTADPADQSVFTVQPDDIPILEAYANASRVYYQAVITDMTVRPAEFAPYVLDSGAKYEAAFEAARAKNQVGSLGTGVILRPYVLADRSSSTEAVLLDCYLQDEHYVTAGQTDTLGSLVPKGVAATMSLVDGSWKLNEIGAEPNACV